MNLRLHWFYQGRGVLKEGMGGRHLVRRERPPLGGTATCPTHVITIEVCVSGCVGVCLCRCVCGGMWVFQYYVAKSHETCIPPPPKKRNENGQTATEHTGQ